MKDVFERAGITVTAENKRELDELLHGLVHVKYKQCPAAWHEVKELKAKDADDLARRLKALWKKRPKK